MADYLIKRCTFVVILLSIPAAVLSINQTLTKPDLVQVIDQDRVASEKLGTVVSSENFGVTKSRTAEPDIIQLLDQNNGRLLNTVETLETTDTAKHATIKTDTMQALDQTNEVFRQLGTAPTSEQIAVTNHVISTTDILRSLDQKNLAFGRPGTAGTSERLGLAKRVTSNLLSACTLINTILSKSENVDVMTKTIALADLLAANSMENGTSRCSLDSYLSVVQILIDTCTKLDACARPTSSLLSQSGQSVRSTSNEILMDDRFSLQHQPLNAASRVSTGALTSSISDQQRFTSNAPIPHVQMSNVQRSHVQRTNVQRSSVQRSNMPASQGQFPSQISQRMAQISNWLTAMERLMASQQRILQVRNAHSIRRPGMQTPNDQTTSIHQNVAPSSLLSNQQRQQLLQQQQVQEVMKQMSSGPMSLVQARNHHVRPVIRSRAMRFRAFPQQPFMMPFVLRLNEQQKRRSRFQTPGPSGEGSASQPAPDTGD